MRFVQFAPYKQIVTLSDEGQSRIWENWALQEISSCTRVFIQPDALESSKYYICGPALAVFAASATLLAAAESKFSPLLQFLHLGLLICSKCRLLLQEMTCKSPILLLKPVYSICLNTLGLEHKHNQVCLL